MYSVIFDTNCYRGIVYDSNKLIMPRNQISQIINDIRQLELAKGISTFANGFVMIELMAHLSDISDPAYDACSSALFALAEHTESESPNEGIRYLENNESNLCRILLGQVPEESQKIEQMIIGSLGVVHKAQSSQDVLTCKPLFDMLKKHVEEMECHFINDIKNYVTGSFAGSSDWKIVISDSNERTKFREYVKSEKFKREQALAQVIKACRTMKQKMPSLNKLEAMVNTVYDLYKAPFEVYSEIITRLVNSGYDMEKKNRVNSLWDIQILYSFSSHGDIDGRKSLLVTNDKMMLECSNSDQCISMDDYFSLIGYTN